MLGNTATIGVEKPPSHWDLELPIAIVGGGACGLTAAIAASQAGADVFVFERSKTPSGSTAMSYGSICAAGTALQSRAGIEDDTAALAEDIVAAADGRTDPALAKLLAESSRIALDWFTEDLGLDFSIEKNWTGFGHRVPRLHSTPNRNGEELMAMLLDKAAAAGVTLVTDAHVTTLHQEDDDEILGISYNSPGGVLFVRTGAVILASSGYAANATLVSKHLPAMETATYYGAETHQGDALVWGQAIKAQCKDLGAYQALANLAIPHNIVVPHTLLVDGGFSVNVKGERFHNELVNISGQALIVIEQPDHFCWIIYDQAGHEKAASIFAEYRDGIAAKAYKTAETVDALATEIGVPSSALQKTFEAVRQSGLSDIPTSFSRTFGPDDMLRPPYFAVKVTGALFHTQGGLVIDHTARVKLQNGKVMRNLFAGGGAARSVSGPAEWGYLPGIGLSTAVSFGKIAGEQAARLVS